MGLKSLPSEFKSKKNNMEANKMHNNTDFNTLEQNPISTPQRFEDNNPKNITLEISQMFTNKVYTLPDGKYRAYITLGKFTVRDGKHRWLLNFELEDGRIFETQFALPLNLDFGFGKAIYELKDQIKEFTGDCIENNYVILEIKNRIYNDRNYSNIISMRLDNEIEQEI